MNPKIIILFAIAAVALAYPHHDDGHYKFEYGVHDPHTHDVKEQHEHRDGKHLTGGYTFKEADGTQRVVKYKSGPHSGFEAIVERKGHAEHPHHATSYVGVIHWGNQGPEEHGH